MARGIIDCKNRTINIGDRVRTATGEVIQVVGAAIGEKFHNAELCELVPNDTPLTPKNLRGGKDDDASDCVVWGG